MGSLAAKFIAREWGLPLLKLDAGRLYEKYVGDSEKNFRKAIVNGVRWTAHLDVPAEGAPVDITAKDMELPPKKTK